MDEVKHIEAAESYQNKSERGEKLLSDVLMLSFL